jgi:hypothetical protein
LGEMRGFTMRRECSGEDKRRKRQLRAAYENAVLGWLFCVRGGIELVENRGVWRDYLAYSAYNLS